MDQRLKEIAARKAEIRSALDNKDSKINLEETRKELEAIAAEEKEIRAKQELANQINNNGAGSTVVVKPEGEKRNMPKKLGLDSAEYRQAFMEFAKTGQMADEFRSVSLTSGNSAVIPPTVLNKIIEKVESYGNILPLVSYMNYPAGVSVPTSELTAPAVFTTDAALASGGVSVDGKTTGSVTFAAYPLVKAIGLSFMAQVQTLSAFEANIADNVSKAMAKGLEQAIISGSGTGCPKGILNSTPVATPVSLSATLGYKDIINIRKSIPAAYRTGAVLVMNEGTFWDFFSIVDNAGQPVARMNMGIDGDPVYQLLGMKVVVTDWMPTLEAAAAGATVAFVLQMDKYVVNNAYNIDLVTYVEQTTRNKVYQSFAAVDGKLVDANGLLFVNKKAA